jgi:hypothetical protein
MKNPQAQSLQTLLLFSITMQLAGCGSSQSSSTTVGTSNPSNYTLTLSGPNVIPVTVGKSTVCGQSNVNQPCTSVTICVPGGSTCQTISDVLVDTGSTGLRLFSSVVTLSLTAVTDSSSHPIAECATFGTGSDWGPVVTAQMNLASETPVTGSIQLINSSYATKPSSCSGADTSPSEAGFNGILGVGLFQQDCGSYCVSHSSSSPYYSCNGSTCTNTTLALSSQLENPISLLPADNNGLIFELPLISTSGGATASGAIVLGIGTQSNNSPSGATAFATNSEGYFNTTFNGSTSNSSFIDSGSNGLFFSSSITQCSSGFYCPSSTQSLTAVIGDTTGSTQVSVSFSIMSESTLVATGDSAFNDLGGTNVLSGFDWGLPFFFGRKVYVGFEGGTSSIGSGTYWAF